MMKLEQRLSRTGVAMQQSAIRQMGAVLAGASDIVSFAPGYPDESIFPWDDFRAIADDLLSTRRGSVLQYGPTRGDRALLDAVEALMLERGIATTREQLAVTNGSQQGLDLIARVLLDPGDVVLVELPSYTGAIAAFRGVGADLVGVHQTGDGCDLEALDDAIVRLRSEGRRVKFFYTVPNFQNPTGLVVSLEKRLGMLEWAERHDVLIVEDDPYRDLYFSDLTTVDQTRAIATDDQHGRVIYLSSFSKTLAPGLRVAWVNAPAALTARIELCKQAADLCTGGLGQHIVAEACRRGILSQQLPLLRRHYMTKRDALEDALRAEAGGALTWESPRGGFFLWVTLPDGVDGETLLPLAVDQGVIFVVGSAFFVSDPQRRCIRLSFSAPSIDRIQEGVRRFGAALRAARQGATTTVANPAVR